MNEFGAVSGPLEALNVPGDFLFVGQDILKWCRASMIDAKGNVAQSSRFWRVGFFVLEGILRRVK